MANMANMPAYASDNDPARELRFRVDNPWGYGRGVFVDREASEGETFRFLFKVEAGELYDAFQGGRCVACLPVNADADDIIKQLAEWYGNADDIYEV